MLKGVDMIVLEPLLSKMSKFTWLDFTFSM